MWFFAGPFAVMSTWISVVEQSIVISVFLVTTLVMPGIQRMTFDAVLSRECTDENMLSKLRKIVQVPFWVKCGNVIVKIPYQLNGPYILTRAILLLLIGLIPFIGPCLVLVLQAPSKGMQAHARYYALKGYSTEKIKAFARENNGAYLGFGIMLLLLELIPFINVFFMFTNNLGAALWAVEIERNINKQRNRAMLPMNKCKSTLANDTETD